MSLKNKLNRLKPHIVRDEQVMEPKGPAKKESDIPFLDTWTKENVVPYYFDGSYCLIREVTYPLSHKHGNYPFSDCLRAIDKWNEERADHPLSAAGHSPDDLFFFDTETTGLSGGAGNTIFLLGHARISGDTVKLTQHILPHPGAEVALYNSFLENVDYRTLVTYNGKAFDWPQVKTRHTLVRDHVPKLPAFGHFDLFHASRRMWKHKLEKMKLSIVEKEILGFERKDDIPGFLAPMIYFDFLERNNPEGLLGIIKHNEMDILSLITLYTHLSFQLLKLDQKQTERERLEVGKWYSYIGQSEKAKQVFEDVSGGTEAVSANHGLAIEHKRNKNWAKAAELWIFVSSHVEHPLSKTASIELAMYFEHKEKSLNTALEYCYQAQKLHEVFPEKNEKKHKKLSTEIEHRIRRLKKKLELL